MTLEEKIELISINNESKEKIINKDKSIELIDESKIEVISINDVEESTKFVVPYERQLVDSVIEIWKLDPETENLGIKKLYNLVKQKNPQWSVSEKRLKTLLKKYGLLTNVPQFTYSNEIKSFQSDPISNDKINIVMTTKRGKGLYAKKNLKKGELLWQEPPLFFIPPLSNLHLIKKGMACSYCGKLLLSTSCIDCDNCCEKWCSSNCQSLDEILHPFLKHIRKSTKQINGEEFGIMAEYCLNEDWNALYALTLIHANNLLNDEKKLKFNKLARVSQAIRYKALNSGGGSGTFDNLNGGGDFIQEQQDLLWKQGYKQFIKVFPDSIKLITFDEFLHMIGTYNINNVDTNIYHIQSHLNHNCQPNVIVDTSSNRTQGLKVFAGRDINSGEELTTSYVNPSHLVHQRQRELRVNWGFICNCQKCKSDLNVSHRRKSSSNPTSKAEIKEMLAKGDQSEIELEIPTTGTERRKSVRFDEKVIAVLQ